MKSWGFLEDVCEAERLVDMNVQERGHTRRRRTSTPA